MATAKPKTSTPKTSTTKTATAKTAASKTATAKAAASASAKPARAAQSAATAKAKPTATRSTTTSKPSAAATQAAALTPPPSRKSAKKGPGIGAGKKVAKRPGIDAGKKVAKRPGIDAGKKVAKRPGIDAAKVAKPTKKIAKVEAVKAVKPRAASDDAPATKPVVAGELQVGSKAPPFELLGDDGKRHGLASFKGKRFVLYFYPKDDTPGCTKEACQFSELPGFESLGVPVLGVSADSIESHKKFRAKYGLTVGLLSDPGNTVALQYGAYGEKVMYGKRVVGTKRSTFLIGADGRIEKIWRNVRADGHAAEVFAALAR